MTYCEGFVVLPLPNPWADIEHGWCVTTDGMVIDVTLGTPGLSYFGAPFSPEEVAKAGSVPLIDEIIENQLTEILRLPERKRVSDGNEIKAICAGTETGAASQRAQGVDEEPGETGCHEACG